MIHNYHQNSKTNRKAPNASALRPARSISEQEEPVPGHKEIPGKLDQRLDKPRRSTVSADDRPGMGTVTHTGQKTGR